MSKSDFASTIISKLDSSIGKDGSSYTEGSVTSAMKAVAEGITDYLIANTEVKISYTGIIASTPPVPDPVVSDTFKITGKCAPTGASDSFDSWIKQIESNIIAGFMLDKQGTNGVVFATKPFMISGISLTQSVLKAAHDIQDEEPQHKVWEIVCGGIMDWLNGAAMNTIPGTATRPSANSAGTASIVKITVS